MHPFWSNLNFFSRDEDAVENRLKSAPMFRDLSNRGMKAIRDLCHLRDYAPGEHIFREGEPGVGMYVILEGTVDIYKKDKRRERHFAALEPGDFFGELALLEDLPRTASAMAQSHCRIIGFFRPDLLSILERKPRIGVQIMLNMARLIGARLISANQELDRLDQEMGARDKSRLRKKIWQDD
ncbi:MAG: cyclic nucleotide-binding domain-containing protein [Leptospirales bacterium]|nr:cyclic nucleotide-binding domain-containing protein [Leptospirales bacterium]